MIYICTAPCEGCSRACNTLEKYCSKLERICGCCSTFFCSWFDRPLGGLILIAATTTVSAAILAGISLGEEKVRGDGGGCDGYWLQPLWFCCVDIALAVLHVAFLVYFQQRLLFRLQSEPRTDDGDRKPVDADQHAPPERPPAELLHRAFAIMAYDVGFCIYVFVFLFSLVANMLGIVSCLECLDGADDTQLPQAAAALNILFAVVAVCFVVLWLFALTVNDDECCCCCCFAQPARQQDKRQQSRLPQLSRSLSRIVAGRPPRYAPQSCPAPALPAQVCAASVCPAAAAPALPTQQGYGWPPRGSQNVMAQQSSLGMRRPSPHPAKARRPQPQRGDEEEDEGCCPCMFPGVGSSGDNPRPPQPQQHLRQQQQQQQQQQWPQHWSQQPPPLQVQMQQHHQQAQVQHWLQPQQAHYLHHPQQMPSETE